MMKDTHDEFAAPFWLGTTLVVNLVAPGQPVPLLVAVVGALLTQGFLALAGGKLASPDRDLRTWNERPKAGYPLWGHRGITHRWWFASIVVTLIGLLPLALLVLLAGVPWRYALLVLVPASNWCSHLAGDMWFGRLKVLGKSRGLGWTTGGGAEPTVRKQLRAWVVALLAAHGFLATTQPELYLVPALALVWCLIWSWYWVPKGLRRVQRAG